MTPQVGRICYIAASVAFVVIGVLHVLTHVAVLMQPEVIDDLSGVAVIVIFGTPAAVPDLWNGLSLLMGFFSIALGAINLAVLRHGIDPIVCGINILMLVVVGLVGWAYLGPIQMLGAPAGIVCFGLAILSRR